MFTVLSKAVCRASWRRFLCCVLAALLTLAGSMLPALAQGRGTVVPSLTEIPLGGVVFPAGQGLLSVPPSGISARGAVLMEASTGDVIYGQNENARLSMASTTKIMTALVAIEALPLDTAVTIPPEAVGIEGSSVYLCEGEVLTMEELLYALLLASANDAATAIAIAVSGSVEGFADRMNEKAESLGLASTHFVNPHGLDDPEHYTTALELAIITREALRDPVFRKICSTARKTIPLHGDEGVRLLINHNKLLSSYEGCIGVKTGFTKKTGRCLVSAAERDGVTLIAVTLGAPDDWRDHKTLLDYGFATYESLTLCETGAFSMPLWLISGVQEYVMVENPSGLSAVLRRDHGEIRCTVELPRFAFASVMGGEVMGRLRFTERTADGSLRELGCVDLTACYGVEEVTYKSSLRNFLRELLFP